MIKKIVYKNIFVVLLLLISFIIPAYAEGDLNSNLNDIVHYYQQNKNTLDNWEEVVGLKNAGIDISKEPWELSKWKIDNLNDDSEATDYASIILGMLAAEQTPGDINDRDVVAELVAKQTTEGDFGGTVNNTIWSVIALDTANAEYDKDKAIQYLINNQKTDGGFTLVGDSGDPDATGMALIALSSHTDIDGVNESIAKIKTFLHSIQIKTGGFKSGSLENPESISAAIRGLIACGEDITAAEWQQDGKTMIDALFAFQKEDNSFAHVVGGNIDFMATRQALIAIGDLINGNVFYNIKNGQTPDPDPGEGESKKVRVRVEGAAGSLANEEVSVSGTALDALKAAVGVENVIDSTGYVTSIFGESGQMYEDISTNWGYYVIRDGVIDEKVFDLGAGNYNVENGDEIVFYIGAMDTSWNYKTYYPEVRISLENPTAGQTVNLNISAKKYVWGSGFQFLSTDETNAIGNYTVIVGEDIYTSQFGQVTIPNLQEGTVNYTVYNTSYDGTYPDVITYKGSIEVGAVKNSQVRVRIEGAVRSLANEEVSVSGTALDALKAAVGVENVIDSTGYVTSIFGESGQTYEDISTNWGYYVIRDGVIDEKVFDLGAGNYNVENGDEIVFYIGAMDTSWNYKTYYPEVRINLENPTVGQSVTLNISAKKYVWGSGLQNLSTNEKNEIGDYSVKIGDKIYTSQDGKVIIPNISGGIVNYIVYNQSQDNLYPDIVTYKGSFKFNSVIVPVPEEIRVYIAVVGKNNALLYGPKKVLLSEDEDNVLDVLLATGLDIDLENENFVKGIEGLKNRGISGWKYKINNHIPTISADSKTVSSGDKIIWWYAEKADSEGPSWSEIEKLSEDMQSILNNTNSEIEKLKDKLENGNLKPTEIIREISSLMDEVEKVIEDEDTKNKEAVELINNLLDITSLMDNEVFTAKERAEALKKILNEKVKKALIELPSEAVKEIKGNIQKQIQSILERVATIIVTQLEKETSDDKVTFGLTVDTLQKQLSEIEDIQKHLEDVFNNYLFKDIVSDIQQPVKQIVISLGNIGNKNNTDLKISQEAMKKLDDNELQLAIKVNKQLTVMLGQPQTLSKVGCIEKKGIQLAFNGQVFDELEFNRDLEEKLALIDEGYVLSIKELEENQYNKLIKDAEKLSNKNLTLKPVGRVYILDLKKEVIHAIGKDLEESFQIKINYSDEVKNPNLLGIYSYEKGNFHFQGAELDITNKTISAKLQKFETFVLLDYSKKFNDTESHWAEKEIGILSSKHIISGKNATNFAPNQTITRAECSVLLTKALGLKEEKSKVDFTDIPENAWYSGYIAIAVKENILKGTSKTTFNPNSEITRAELAVMIDNALKNKLDKNLSETNILTKYKDVNEIPAWAKVGISHAVELGIMSGKTSDNLAVKDKVTRAEAAVMIYHMFNKLD